MWFLAPLSSRRVVRGSWCDGVVRRGLGAVLLAAGLAACSDAPPSAGTAGVSAQARQQQDESKLSAYVKGYNTLIERLGLQDQAERYLKQDIQGGKTAGNSLTFPLGGFVERPVDQIRAARAQPSEALAGLDAAVDAFLTPMDALIALHREHSAYFESKAYLDDDLARGKQIDPLIRQAWADVLAGFNTFDAAITEQLKQRRQAELERLKAEDNKLPYYTLVLLQDGETVLEQLTAVGGKPSAAQSEQLDALMQQFEANTRELQDEIERQKAAGDPQGPSATHLGWYRSLYDNAVTFTGRYRSLRRTGREFDLEQMIQSYNGIVKWANSLSRG